MSRIRKTYVIAPLGIVLLAAFLILPPVMEKRAALRTIRALGFTPIVIDSTSKEKGRTTFSNIQLDADGFSSIDKVSIESSLRGLETIYLEHPVLSAEIKGARLPSVTGWSMPRNIDFSEISDVDVSNGQIDILTPEGAIRLTITGQAKQQPNNDEKISAVIKGAQNQLTIDTRWEAVMHPSGAVWTAAAEIREGRINLENFLASRISGWLNLDKNKGAFLPLLSGQVSAGQMRLGDNTVLANATVTFDDTDEKQNLILQADIAPYENMRITAEIHNIASAPYIESAIETGSLDDLMRFIATFQDDWQAFSGKGNVLTSLLITPGNMARLTKEVKRVARYDSLELSITGTPYDLVGKIIAKQEKKGVIQRHVISLDPG